MPMVKMITQSDHVYAGRALRAGDEFDCEPQHVHVMETLGRARVAKGEVPNTYQTRDMSAAGKRRRSPRVAK